MSINTAEKKYLHNVEKNLKCSSKSKESCILSLKQFVSEGANQNDLICYDDYVLAFGEPKQIAKDYMQELDPEEIRKYANKRRLCIIAVVFLVVCAIVLSVYFAMLYHETPIYEREGPAVTESEEGPLQTDEFGNPI